MRIRMRMRRRMKRVFNVERSVVKVVAHAPAGICPLPVFPPGLRINVEVVVQSQLGDIKEKILVMVIFGDMRQ